MKDDRQSPFRGAHEDVETARDIPDTPQTRAPAYRLAFADDDFLCRDELRPVRLQLELQKPELILNEQNIESTVVMFGGARIPAPDAQGQRAHRNAGGPVGAIRRGARIRPADDIAQHGKLWPRERHRHRRRSRRDGGRQSRRRGCGRPFHRAEHRAALRAGPERIRDARLSASTSTISRSARCTS